MGFGLSFFIDHPAAEGFQPGHEFEGLNGGEAVGGAVAESGAEATEPLPAGGFIDRKGKVTGAHSRRAVLLDVKRGTAHNADEKFGLAFGGGFEFIADWEHAGNGTLTEELVDVPGQGIESLGAHVLIKSGGIHLRRTGRRRIGLFVHGVHLRL